MQPGGKYIISSESRNGPLVNELITTTELKNPLDQMDAMYD